MALRKCAACGECLPAGATARARFCSATCRKRASRSKGGDTVPLALVPPADATPDDVPMSRLDALERAAARLVRLLDESDPRSAAALNKEYRETLRELESLRDAAASTGAGGVHGGSDGHRRPFSATAL